MLLVLFIWIATIAYTLYTVIAKPWYIASIQNRDKLTAVKIAIFLGPWTWFYTYEKDYRKFWPSVLLILGVRAIAEIVPDSLAELMYYPGLAILILIWVLTITIALIRKEVWYETYGGLPPPSKY